MLRVLTWFSQEHGDRLTPQEIDTLAGFTYEMAQLGQLTNGKYVGATESIYWERTKGGN